MNKEKKDLLLSLNLNDFDSRYLFAIYYALDISEYKIKFNLIETDKLDELSKIITLQIPYGIPYYISKKNILILSKTTFQIAFIVNSIIEITHLSKKQKYIYNPLAIQEITIGKAQNCTIYVDDDKDISLIHSTLNYDSKKKSWLIRDGSDIKESKTGTKIFGLDSYIVHNTTKLLINECILDIKV